VTEGRPVWPDEARFQCLPGCGLCCSYRVVLSTEDQERLREAGCQARREETADGKAILPREDGFCLFLDRDRRCGVYADRPAQCRTYPYLPSPYEQPELDVDLSCPGLGQGQGKPVELSLLPQEGQETRQQAAVVQITDLLRGRQLLAPQDVLVACGKRLVEELEQGWPAARQMGQVLGPMINLEAQSGDEDLWKRLALPLTESPPPTEDPAFMDRHFATWRWNTRLVDSNQVALYRFRWNGEGWQVEEADGTRRKVPWAEGPWGQAGLDTRRAYLMRWLRRQLPVRLAHHVAVASPWPVHTARAYVEFLTEVDRRIKVLSEAIAGWRGADQVDPTHVLEAVRGSDGILKSWCQKARTEVPAGQFPA